MGWGGCHKFYQAAQFLLWSKEFAIWFLELEGVSGHGVSSQAGLVPLTHHGLAALGPEQPPTPTGNRAEASASAYTQYYQPFPLLPLQNLHFSCSQGAAAGTEGPEAC